MDDDNDPQIYTYMICIYIYITYIFACFEFIERPRRELLCAGWYRYWIDSLQTSSNRGFEHCSSELFLQKMIVNCKYTLWTSAVNWFLSNSVYIFKHIDSYFKKLRLTHTFSMYLIITSYHIVQILRAKKLRLCLAQVGLARHCRNDVAVDICWCHEFPNHYTFIYNMYILYVYM